jgi:hypothetical protein
MQTEPSTTNGAGHSLRSSPVSHAALVKLRKTRPVKELAALVGVSEASLYAALKQKRGIREPRRRETKRGTGALKKYHHAVRTRTAKKVAALNTALSADATSRAVAIGKSISSTGIELQSPGNSETLAAIGKKLVDLGEQIFDAIREEGDSQ